jgi:hypothetical protein
MNVAQHKRHREGLARKADAKDVRTALWAPSQPIT